MWFFRQLASYPSFPPPSLHSLMEACFHGHVQCAELLVQHGSSCLTRDYSGFSSLHYAVDGGNIDMVNFVLNEKVPVHYISYFYCDGKRMFCGVGG